MDKKMPKDVIIKGMIIMLEEKNINRKEIYENLLNFHGEFKNRDQKHDFIVALKKYIQPEQKKYKKLENSKAIKKLKRWLSKE
jgi:hypothetical protein